VFEPLKLRHGRNEAETEIKSKEKKEKAAMVEEKRHGFNLKAGNERKW
jgi:hypothetical protein